MQPVESRKDWLKKPQIKNIQIVYLKEFPKYIWYIVNKKKKECETKG